MAKAAPVRMPATGSVAIKHFRNAPLLFEWHQHDTYELVLTLGDSGTRIIGHSVAPFGRADLALIAPHVPHTWDGDAHYEPHHEVIVVLWSANLFQNSPIPEFQAIQYWLDSLHQGASFSEETAYSLAETLRTLEASDPANRLATLIQILSRLSRDDSEALSISMTQHQDSRLSAVLNYINDHLNNAITLEKCAEVGNCSIATLKRLFSQQLNSSFSDYLKTCRIEKACYLLATTGLPINLIAEQSGYQSLRQFNHSFKSARSMTPSLFRKQHHWRHTH
ncbi:AraC family transcriptional regulator [Thaumasiovibrio subtropicus]|uniref:AraC family transcriptional regulator n=1 Tax=Thaumasiovibrio subtropicus TaxID=1891207 RepID=UPI000B359D35|nr:AraC family transcriptional regulator [Thaumasiovibrio subtropicus]